jgi:ABC-type dipeptide/oligopeptide/nickel transport system permease component
MSKYLLRRLLQSVPVIIGVALIAFVLTQFSGNPVRSLLAQGTNPETIRKVTEFYGFDKPWYVRFGKYMNDLAHGNLGVSIEREGQEIKLGIPEQLRAMASAIIPLGRPATPEEAAGPVFFLCSPWANYIHGQVINVTGGQFGGMYT